MAARAAQTVYFIDTRLRRVFDRLSLTSLAWLGSAWSGKPAGGGHVAFEPDGGLLVFGTGNGAATVSHPYWPVRRAPRDGALRVNRISPDGRLVVGSATGRSARGPQRDVVKRVDSGERVLELPPATRFDGEGARAFSSFGKVFAFGSHDGRGVIRLWRPAAPGHRARRRGWRGGAGHRAAWIGVRHRRRGRQRVRRGPHAADPVGHDAGWRAQRPGRLALAFAAALQPGVDFEVERALTRVRLTDAGRERVEDALDDGAVVLAGAALPQDATRRGGTEAVTQALSALWLYHRDQQYMMADGKVQIIDETTGRVMADSACERGLHQLIEAKGGGWRSPASG